MTTITKTVDLRDVEVEVDFDADDLSEMSAADLWEALTNNESADTIADLVTDDDDVLTRIKDDLAESFDSDDLCVAFDSFATTQKRSVLNHIVEEFIRSDTDEAKRLVATLIGYDVETGSMIQPVGDQALREFIREALDIRLPEAKSLKTVISDMICHKEFSVNALIRDLLDTYSAGYIAGVTMDEAVRSMQRTVKTDRPE